MLKIIFYSISLLSLLGCGGGSQHEPREIKRVYFKGSVTNGINYSCGERQGVSKSYTKQEITTHGTITCIYAPLKLSLGSLYLGEVSSIKDEQNIYPQTLVPLFDGDFNNPEVLKRAILLQSLDDKISNEYISISQETRDKITLDSLDNLTIKELNEAIRKMGFTPVTQENAKIYLIMHSENTNIGKPIIEPFTEDISSSLMVGSTIGQLAITKGDGTLHYPFTLQGEGAEYFFLNEKGKLILIQNLEKEIDCNLTVTATNEYGYSTQTIYIHIEESQKVGKVQLDGVEEGLTVKLFKLNKNKTKDFISSTTTNKRGSFDLMSEHLDDHEFYIYESENNIRLITKGIWIKNAMHKIRITPLSEMLYTYVKNISYNQLEEKLDHYATLLLKNSLDSNHNIDTKDIMIFDPTDNKKALSYTLDYNNTYQKITNKIRLGDQSYQSDIFLAYTLISFPSNAIEIVGSTIYTVDMINSGEFRIYNLETKKLIGKLKLPNTPVEEDTHVIYLNLVDRDIRVSSLDDWSYSIDIRNQRAPRLIVNPFISNSILSGNFYNIAIGKSNNENIFSKEHKLYFHSKVLEDNSLKIIKFYTINRDGSTFYYNFNSQLNNITSLWAYRRYLYIIGDNKIHIFQKEGQRMQFISKYEQKTIRGNILGIEENILYILNENILTLLDINNPLNPEFIESISVPFRYKLGIKTNGSYITTGSKVISIKALRASKNAM